MDTGSTRIGSGHGGVTPAEVVIGDWSLAGTRGDLRSVRGRGRETRAQRVVLLGQRGLFFGHGTHLEIVNTGSSRLGVSRVTNRAGRPGFFSGSTEFNDIGGQAAMKDGALPR